MAHEDGTKQFIVVSCYTQFDNLAHKPRGTPSQHGMQVFGFDSTTGLMTTLSINTETGDTVVNPAFSRFHPTLNVLYSVSESVKNDGYLTAYAVDVSTGELCRIGQQSCLGTSTCYITTAPDLRNLLYVNYWDSTLGAMPIDAAGRPLPVEKQTRAPSKDGGEARQPQQHGDDPHSKHRTEETHAHAIVLDPCFGRVAFVPDLGEDCIKQFVYDRATGALDYAGWIPCGNGPKHRGPRYIEFHPTLNVAYTVNELASTVSVYTFVEERLRALAPGSTDRTLQLAQEIDTVPTAFPRKMNTCGRICVSPSGKHVLVSNRGHDSVVVYEVMTDPCSGSVGQLRTCGYFHTSGATPRHFAFDLTGKWFFVANQDSNCVSVFKFNEEEGSLTYAQSYSINSPNFVCPIKPHKRTTAAKARL